MVAKALFNYTTLQIDKFNFQRIGLERICVFWCSQHTPCDYAANLEWVFFKKDGQLKGMDSLYASITLTLHLIPTSHLIQTNFPYLKKLKEVIDWC